MTIHRLHAGDGYQYLTRQVASGDRLRDRTRDLTDYYLESGTPPGIWLGTGAARLGVSGNVTEAQMQALFGEGLHPQANAIIAAGIAAGKTATQAVKATGLGASFYEFTNKSSPITDLLARNIDTFIQTYQRRPTWDERTILRSDATREHLTATLGREPERSEIEAALAEEKSESRKAVAGFDLVFTPPKSISILWGLGDDELRAMIWRCHTEAVREVLAWTQSQCAVTRRGHNGIRQIDADGFVIVAFDHFDNRSGDPNLHTHAVVSNKVLGSDGKWSALDARPLYASAVSFSSRYNATIIGKVRRQVGFRFEERPRGRGKQPVLEVVGASDEMIAEFSRTPDIIARTEELVADYRARHGRNPSTIVQYRLAQQATLQTRHAKPLPKTLRDMVTEWGTRTHRFLGDGRDAVRFARDLLHSHTHPDAHGPTDPEQIAIAVGVDLGGPRALIDCTRGQLDHCIEHHLNLAPFTTPAARARTAEAVKLLLSQHPKLALLDRISIAHTARLRAIWTPARIAQDVVDTVARRRATWTEANIRSAVEDRLAVIEFATDAAHRAAVEHITATVRDQHSIQLTLHPDPVPTALARRDGESVFTVTGATRYTSHAVLDAETRLLQSARTPSPEAIPPQLVDAAITRIRTNTKLILNEGQREIARYLCCCATELAVAVGPAGTGKTTAMKAVATAWQASGREVIALAPSASAARELSAHLAIPAHTIDRLLTQAAYGIPTGVFPGTMLLIDEASMAATADFDALRALAHASGAVLRGIGDPEQLPAVEAGGIFRTLARDTRAPQLRHVVRFTDPAEADATLAIRDGNLEQAWEFYNSNDRVTCGMSDQLRAAILATHLEDTAAGISSIMIAATLTDVSALNAATQAHHALTGRINTGKGRVLLSDSHTGYVGDVVVTRLNNPRLRITGGIRHTTHIDNGDLWRIRTIHHDGTITVIGTSHRGSVHLPTDYIRHHVELGYATTIHRAQGITVRRAYVLMNHILGRALAYVGLTRGWELNRIFLATDTLIDPTGNQQPDDPTQPHTMFARVLAREDDNLSAIDIMRAEQTAADHRTRITYTHAYKLLADARGTYLLAHALPVVFYRATMGSPTCQQLLDTLALADAHGLDTCELVAAITTDNYRDLGESLTTAPDTAALLRSRADTWIHAHHPITPPAITTAAVDTLASLTPQMANTLSGRLNTTAVLASPRQQFRALHDSPYTGTLRPVPTRHPTMDLELAHHAEQLRHRLITPTADQLAPPRSDVSSPGVAQADTSSEFSGPLAQSTTTPTGNTPHDPEITAVSSHSDTVDAVTEPHSGDLADYHHINRADRINRMVRDYHHYVKELADARTDQLLYRALPAVLYKQTQKSRHYDELFDTIALAQAHHLDTTTLVAVIATNNYRDLGASLLLVPDPAHELRHRTDTWINTHTTPHDDIHPDHGFRALTDYPYNSQFRPIPNYPDRDNQLADYAHELRQRIQHELNTPPHAQTTPAVSRQVIPPGEG
ncbi:relaxase domain-containing protein [Nocardia sp. NBC_01499]|uniref:MobF family relaxase n=1 Tax=Nocardia sp. NBC_01499 TaxID=2903597 RepID=UPI00386FBDC9